MVEHWFSQPFPAPLPASVMGQLEKHGSDHSSGSNKRNVTCRTPDFFFFFLRLWTTSCGNKTKHVKGKHYSLNKANTQWLIYFLVKLTAEVKEEDNRKSYFLPWLQIVWGGQSEQCKGNHPSGQWNVTSNYLQPLVTLCIGSSLSCQGNHYVHFHLCKYFSWDAGFYTFLFSWMSSHSTIIAFLPTEIFFQVFCLFSFSLPLLLQSEKGKKNKIEVGKMPELPFILNGFSNPCFFFFLCLYIQYNLVV